MFKQDKKGFFLIEVSKKEGVIFATHVENDYKITENFVSTTAEGLCRQILDRDLISEFSHALYLGRELMKAEICLKENKDYEQDVSDNRKS